MAFGFYINEDGGADLGNNANESIQLILSLRLGELRHLPTVAGNINSRQGSDLGTQRLIDVEQALLADGARSAECSISPSLIDRTEDIVSVNVNYPS